MTRPRSPASSCRSWPASGVTFCLPRTLELTRLIWPEVDDWLAKMEAYRPESRVQRRDLAGPGFLRLLRILRTKAAVFVNEAYQAFPTEVAAASEAGEEPEDLQLKKVLPVLYDKITLMHQDLKQSVKLAVSEIVKKTQTTHETAFAGEFQAAVQDFGRLTSQEVWQAHLIVDLYIPTIAVIISPAPLLLVRPGISDGNSPHIGPLDL
ncbi:hypothetical protein V8E54_011741 [Elaphomyces granulatus]